MKDISEAIQQHIFDCHISDELNKDDTTDSRSVYFWNRHGFPLRNLLKKISLIKIFDMLFFSFVVGVTFRALSDDGLLLYATDNDTHPTQFFSVELVQGRILFEFNSGRGLVSVTTQQKYSGNGHWYTVCIMGHLKALLSEDHYLMTNMDLDRFFKLIHISNRSNLQVLLYAS